MNNQIARACLICLALIPVSDTTLAEWLSSLEVSFGDREGVFSKREKQHIEEIATRSEEEVRALLPDLPREISVTVHPVATDLASVGGVTGRADSPSEVAIYISTTFDGGVIPAADTGLAATLCHEFHHLARGWTIEENKFGPGITTAAVNEGLANVFSEIYTDTAFEGNAYPANVRDWLEEVSALPLDASYNHWMNQHPDGRQAVGYKVGSFMIHQALARSDLSILELSALPVEDILGLNELKAEAKEATGSK